jgi:isopentenyl-diphosphate delta-isomerase
MADKTLTELVVLLDDSGHPIGTADKATVHTTETPLHLAFSCHIFNDDGDVLITRRALTKKTWPGVWTNSACGHPGPGESMEDAIRRRAADELGLHLSEVTMVLPDFRYRAVDASGVVENEVCPVFVAKAVGEPAPIAAEVCELQWVNPTALANAVADTPFVFSPWLVDQMAQWTKPYGFDTSVR